MCLVAGLILSGVALLTAADKAPPAPKPLPVADPLAGAVHAEDVWPLAPGNCWIYEGEVATEGQGGKIAKCQVRVAMKVRSTLSSGNGTLYMMDGHPADAAWFKPPTGAKGIVDVPPSRYGLLVLDHRVYRLDKKRAEALLASMNTGTAKPGEVVGMDDEVLDFPLLPGKRFGNPDGLMRDDGRYCWNVDEKVGENAPLGWEGQTQPPAVPPLKSTFATTARLRYRTLPDDEAVGFTPGVGITEYAYSHHGTVGEARLRLTGYWVDGRWCGTPGPDRYDPIKSAGGPSFVTPSYEITIAHLCEDEGCVSCDRVVYHGKSKKTGAEITLMGSTWHHIVDKEGTPGAFWGYTFKNGDITYLVYEDGRLTVLRGKSEVLLDEKGTWRE
jgi:hypothetical protein